MEAINLDKNSSDGIIPLEFTNQIIEQSLDKISRLVVADPTFPDQLFT